MDSRANGSQRKKGRTQWAPCTCIGVDGCPAGWFAVAIGRNGEYALGCHGSIEELWRCAPSARAILIDIPIGLPSQAGAGRRVDAMARAQLAPRRHASVFSPPCREALAARTYAEACRINQRVCGRKLSIQTWHIMPKIKAVDDFLQATPAAQKIIRETHPEICFWALAGGVPMRYSKKDARGRADRLALLQRVYPASETIFAAALARFTRRQVARDDILDALVNAVTALHLGQCGATLPEDPPLDRCGLPMEMVFARPAVGSKTALTADGV